jgi:hypothetical protein
MWDSLCPQTKVQEFVVASAVFVNSKNQALDRRTDGLGSSRLGEFGLDT